MIRSVRPVFTGGGFAGSRTGFTFDRAVPPRFSIPCGNVRIDFFLPAVFLSVGGGGGFPPTFTIFTPDILACIYIAGFHLASLRGEVLLEQEIHMVREDSKLLVENAKARSRLLANVLGRVHGTEQVEDELHGLTIQTAWL